MTDDLRQLIGLIWGKTSTIVLAISVAYLASPIPPPDWTKPYAFWIAIFAAALRAVSKEPV